MNTAESTLATEFEAFEALHRQAMRTEELRWEDRYPCMDDRTAETPFDRHYVYHPAWAARALARTKPTKHVDISSTIAFCSVISAFMPVDFYDYRPAPLKLDGLSCRQADLTSLPFEDDSIESLSCMHVIEHIGLGRYGDPFDANGDLRALSELVRVLRKGGNLLIAVPVGRPRIQFNAHRIYDPEAFKNYVNGATIVEFVVVPDGAAPEGLLIDPEMEFVRTQSYACGCYWFRKT